MAIKQLTKDETATREFTIDTDKQTVAVVHTVKPDGDSLVRYNLKWTFDFKGVTPVEMLTLAAKSVLITVQGKWRKADNRMSEAKWHNVTFRVRDILDEARKPRETKAPTDKVADDLFPTMTPAEQAAYIKRLEASMRKRAA